MNETVKWHTGRKPEDQSSKIFQACWIRLRRRFRLVQDVPA
jgi:hypothetical protein